MDNKKVAEILKKCELFDELSDRELQPIVDLGRIEKFKAGDTILEQGSLGTKIYILSKGQVSLERKVDIGDTSKARVTVFVLKESPNRRLMGCWSSLVGEQHVQMCSAVCDKPTEVVSMPCADLRAIMLKHSGIRVKILEKLVLLLRDRIDSSYGAFETL
ncbi:MAG: cyclic nucleotide-binding domain-containing protein [Pseudomonadota bacterium]|uniref:Cyclic nucleotide-binding domain-containing protein n=1 Tax=Candidatus Desulfatibia profunda TaxID=2841695 RepID=A0A8J6NTU6_9BACT|nr:cyclic nucleotide-binding domain-containing protein [Candidatus Desulfatibia profunda]MBL7179466.1 cyclic nucleotide-binding domain-containing protein [Desulfobacterales bacterium]MBU0698509.1 cyclic nucleotide-binding domain-containing protein [Pseudomonadota bacterium]